jgi:hypothetical protein
MVVRIQQLQQQQAVRFTVLELHSLLLRQERLDKY